MIERPMPESSVVKANNPNTHAPAVGGGNDSWVWQQFLANSKSCLSRRLSFGECFFETQRSQREHTQSLQRTLCELCVHLCELCVSKKHLKAVRLCQDLLPHPDSWQRRRFASARWSEFQGRPRSKDGLVHSAVRFLSSPTSDCPISRE